MICKDDISDENWSLFCMWILTTPLSCRISRRRSCWRSSCRSARMLRSSWRMPWRRKMAPKRTQHGVIIIMVLYGITIVSLWYYMVSLWCDECWWMLMVFTWWSWWLISVDHEILGYSPVLDNPKCWFLDFTEFSMINSNESMFHHFPPKRYVK